MLPPWLGPRLQELGAAEDKAAKAKEELRAAAPGICLDIINATLKKADAAGIGMEKYWKTHEQLNTPGMEAFEKMLCEQACAERTALQKLLRAMAKNVNSLLQKELPPSVFPEQRRRMLETMFSEYRIIHIPRDMREVRIELVMILYSMREHLEAILSTDESLMSPDLPPTLMPGAVHYRLDAYLRAQEGKKKDTNEF